MTPPSDPVDRRRFLALLASLAAAGCTVDTAGDDTTTTRPVDQTAQDGAASPTTTGSGSTAAQAQGELALVEPLAVPPLDVDHDPFELGVASGDPGETSVVLWTRLVHAELPTEAPVLWEVATDETFEQLLATGTAVAVAGDAHTVRAIPNSLPSGRTMNYRFKAGEFTSPIGRTKTTPTAESASESVRLAVSSCQLMETGYFTAHRDLANSDVDLVIWLGDYIYEGGGSSILPGRSHVPPAVSDLDGYRARYAQYRSDADLQAAHAAHPWMVMWDDHEVLNDYTSTVDADRRLAAYQAWWEHMPTRLPRPTADGLEIHRSQHIGPLVKVIGIDVRQYATADALLGPNQTAWLADELSNSDATWTILASPVLVGGLNASLDILGDPLLPYTWDGYPSERVALAKLLANRDAVVVSGDLHTSMTLDVRPNLFDDERATVAPEFMAPAISSAFPDDYADAAPLLPLLNPQMRHIDTANGWLLLEATASTVTATFRLVTTATDPASEVTSGTSWRVERDQPVAVQI